jgi:hypothetical protein
VSSFALEGAVYLNALGLIRSRGWWQGPSTVPGNSEDGGQTGADGSLCLASSVVDAVDGDPAPYLSFLRRVLNLAEIEGNLADWNDAPGRTLEEVERALLSAGRLAGHG